MDFYYNWNEKKEYYNFYSRKNRLRLVITKNGSILIKIFKEPYVFCSINKHAC